MKAILQYKTFWGDISDVIVLETNIETRWSKINEVLIRTIANDRKSYGYENPFRVVTKKENARWKCRTLQVLKFAGTIEMVGKQKVNPFKKGRKKLFATTFGVT